MGIFTEAWAGELCRLLNESDAYNQAASNWEGAVVLEDSDSPRERSVFLDLHRGACRGARVATDVDREEVDYMLTATKEDWLGILNGVSPVTALLSGKLKLTRGGLAALMPHMKAANELVMVARAVDAGDDSPTPTAGSGDSLPSGGSPILPVSGGRSQAPD
jgi:putative sterol carrier protein